MGHPPQTMSTGTERRKWGCLATTFIVTLILIALVLPTCAGFAAGLEEKLQTGVQVLGNSFDMKASSI